MRNLFALVAAAPLWAGCPSRSVEDLLPAYSKAYDTAFRRMGALGLADTQARVGAPRDPNARD